MEFQLIIDKAAPETVVATVRQRSEFTDQIEALVLQHQGANFVTAYRDEDIKQLPFESIECFTVIGGKTFAIDTKGRQYRVKHRLYELEAMLPECFIRINKSALVNEHHLVEFTASFSGAVDAVLRSGYREYVSRRCFAAIKRRFEEK